MIPSNIPSSRVQKYKISITLKINQITWKRVQLYEKPSSKSLYYLQDRISVYFLVAGIINKVKGVKSIIIIYYLIIYLHYYLFIIIIYYLFIYIYPSITSYSEFNILCKNIHLCYDGCKWTINFIKAIEDDFLKLFF